MANHVTRQDISKQSRLESHKDHPPQLTISPSSVTRSSDIEEYQPRVNWRFIIWSVFGTLILIAGVAYTWTNFFVSLADESPGDQSVSFVVPLSTPTPLSINSATPTIGVSPSPNPTLSPLPVSEPKPTSTSSRDFSFSEPTPTPTPIPGGRSLVLASSPGDTGWVVSEDESIFTDYDPQNHFGDSFLYAGILDGKVYHAAFQFDLRQIPRGTEIYGASLRLTGLRDDQLQEAGEWQVQFLSSEIDPRWRYHNYQQISQADEASTLAPILSPDQLGEGQINVFEFTPEQIDVLEQRVYEGSDEFGRQVSFRIDGPIRGDNNLFAWDSGNGPASKGKESGPQLFLSLGPLPEETPPPYYVIITSTPTPEDIATAVAISLQKTAEAERVGTATPLPSNWVTPMVVTPMPTPENEATAQLMDKMATAVALTTGEPPNLATATPTPTYVIITSTPTPESIMTAVADALRVTAEAEKFGTATPFPSNWVTPAVVTLTPTPQNTATMAYLQAVALTTGTPTPTPGNVQTATPTPVFVTVAPLTSPTATATPTGTPQPVPARLIGKIVFLSDREGATEEERLRADRLQVTPQVTPQPYVFDPETGQLGRLTDIWPYDVAAVREAWSADTNYEVYTQRLLWSNIQTEQGNVAIDELQLHYYDYTYNIERIVTEVGAGIVYDPVWSPVSNQIAFVSNESGNDEIWTIHYDGSESQQLTHNEWEWDKHPSWSPDGQQIIFYSNRISGNNQLWIMNKDGSEQRLLMDWSPYNDWDPVWVKYQEPAPPLERQLDWRFIKPPEESENDR